MPSSDIFIKLYFKAQGYDNMLTYLRSLGSSQVSIDLLVETALSDHVIREEEAEEVITRCFEIYDKTRVVDSQRNVIVIVCKVVSFFTESLGEEVVTSVMERLIIFMTEATTEVRRTVAEYLGLVMLSAKCVKGNPF